MKLWLGWLHLGLMKLWFGLVHLGAVSGEAMAGSLHLGAVSGEAMVRPLHLGAVSGGLGQFLVKLHLDGHAMGGLNSPVVI